MLVMYMMSALFGYLTFYGTRRKLSDQLKAYSRNVVMGIAMFLS